MRGSLRVRRVRESGFTLVEVLVTLLITGIVLAGTYQALTTLQKWWTSVGAKSETSQNVRAGLEAVTRDLEMTGYHTSNYGDPYKTGLAITLAETSRIEVDQHRLMDIASGSYEPRMVYYHLATDLRTGRQNLYRQVRTEPGLPAPDEIVAENIGDFTLAYFDRDNNSLAADLPAQYIAGSTPPAVLKNIRRIQVTMTAAPPTRTVIGGATRPYTLSATVTPPNLTAADEVGVDVNPPAVPTGLAVVDSQECTTKLRVRWNKNSEPDIAGYAVFYGTTERMTFPVTSPDVAGQATPTVELNAENLFVTKKLDISPNTYSVQVAAYDASGNYSDRSAAVAANPGTDETAFGAGNDTTVNPCKPSKPTNPAVVPGSSDNELVISWQAPPTPTPPLPDCFTTGGYRLYRSTTPFANGHIGTTPIADEQVLTKGTTNWTDTGLEECREYYYAIASVNCDETFVVGYQHDATDLSLSDYAVASGTTTDNSNPPTPSLAGSRPGSQRVFITLENPLESVCADFRETRIYWSKAAEPDPDPPPSLNAATGVVSVGGDPAPLIPDTDTTVAGTFTTRGSQVIVFDHETEANPVTPWLDNSVAYSVLAVSYDRCGNHSAASSQTLVTLDQCEDSPEGAPPESPTAATYTSCQADTVKLGWNYPPRYYTGPAGDPQERVTDIAGYHVWRRTGAEDPVELTAGPTWLESWTDAGPLLAGGMYTYTIKVTDCVYEKGIAPANASAALTIGPIYPGSLRHYVPETGADELAATNFVTTVSDSSAPYTYHNNVKFFLQNTSQSPMTIKRMAVTWDNPAVVLDQLVVGGSPSTTSQQTISAGRVASGVAFPVGAVIDGTGGYSGPIPALLRFVTQSGTVTRSADMRSETLSLSLWVRNNSLQDADCPTPDEIVLEVPRGPVLGGFSQDVPGEFGIESYEVTGQSGTARDTDIQVPNGTAVNVFGTLFDNSRDLFSDGVNRGMLLKNVYGIAAAPANPAAVPVMPAGTLFSRDLQLLTGNRYAISAPGPVGQKMPLASDQVVWHYALAVDKTGNWDRVPIPDDGNYAYYQLPPSACLTPNPPTLSIVATPRVAPATKDNAVLTWVRPVTYTTGETIPVSEELKYDVYANSTGVAPFGVLLHQDLTWTSFTHTADLQGTINYYVVVAKSSCTPVKQSAVSNVVRECLGPEGVNCDLFSVPSTADFDLPFPVSVGSVCMYTNGNVTDRVTLRAVGRETKNITVNETSDGNFSTTIKATDRTTGVANEVWSTVGGSMTVALYDRNNTTKLCDPKTVSLLGGGCSTIPRTPSPVNASGTGSRQATVTWSVPFNTPDLAGYEVGYQYRTCAGVRRGRCNNWNGWGAWSSADYVAAPTTSKTYTTLDVGSTGIAQYRFRVRSKDTCATPTTNTCSTTPAANCSTWSVSSPAQVIR